jgi:hypothetical protein
MIRLMIVVLWGASLAVSNGIVVADLNEDGLPDVLVGYRDGWTVHRNLGGLKFAAEVTLRRLGLGEVGGAAAADMNHDGHVDLVLGSHDSFRVAVLLNDGRGTFTAAPGSPFAARSGGKPHNHNLIIADWNGDGHPDVASANIEMRDISIFLGDGKGALRPHGFVATGIANYELGVIDANGDGKLDLVATNIGGEGPAAVLASSDGAGGFRVLRDVFPAVGIRVATLGAFAEVDGTPAFWISPGSPAKPILRLVRKADGSYAASRSTAIAPERSWGMRVADVDADGKPEVVIAAGGGVQVTWGHGRIDWIPTAGGTWYVALADLDRDGRLDVAAVVRDGTGIEAHSLRTHLP